MFVSRHESALLTLLLRSVRHHSTKKSASSNKWINRQINDHYTKSAKFEEYKSRAAYKLLQIDKKFKLFKPGQSVVDLGFAPGAWTQVAVKQTSPNGRVLGVDIIPTMPPKGASALQANILSRKTHVLIQKFFFDLDQSKVKRKVEADTSYLDMELSDNAEPDIEDDDKFERNLNDQHKLPVDLILSDMYGLVFPAERFWNNTTNAAYNRMLNTSGVAVKDHIGSIDLCDASLILAIDLLKPGGAFTCKFFTGSEDKGLEKRLKKVFGRVTRFKPDACRAESKECYFIGQNKRKNVDKLEVFTS